MTFLGIDGGGSKTAFLLVDEHEQPIARTQAGPCNWLSVGPDAARLAIQEGASRLFETPDVVCGGFAGAGRAEGKAFYTDLLRSVFPQSKIIVESDTFIAYLSAIGVDPGVLLIAGTGSIAVGRKTDGTLLRVGGWGPFFGDEGGGFWIGREAIRTALRLMDREKQNEFAGMIAQSLGLASVQQVITAWRAGTLGVPGVAALFSSIVSIYPSEPAGRILREAAGHLRDLIHIAIERVDNATYTLSLSGSVARHPVMRSLIAMEFTEPQRTPEWGAVKVALQSR
jgi:glucosamine kinase